MNLAGTDLAPNKGIISGVLFRLLVEAVGTLLAVAMLLMLAILPERGMVLLPVIGILLPDGPNNPGPLCLSELHVPGYIPPVWEVDALGIEVPGKRGGGCSPCSPSEELLLQWVSWC